MRFSDFSRISEDPRTANPEHLGNFESTCNTEHSVPRSMRNSRQCFVLDAQNEIFANADKPV